MAQQKYLSPPAIPQFPERSGDKRITHFLPHSSKATDSPTLVVVGYPSSLGAKKNGGRTGAEHGPGAIREKFYRLTPDPCSYESFVEVISGMYDLGDLVVEDSVDKNQEHLAETIAPYLAKEIPVVILGGSHDLSYGHFLGYASLKRSVSILNLDAHPDVREQESIGAHSGSPFRDALEHCDGGLKHYSVFGLSPWATSRDHLRYLDERNCTWKTVEKTSSSALTEFFKTLDSNAFLTLDLDGIDSAFAPGVSAPNGAGLKPQLYFQAAKLAGENKRVSSIDICELNPQFDRDGAASQIAALCLWHFIQGLGQRFAS